MEIVLIRHGQPNYSPCDERKFIGQGRDMAPLTDLGVQQAEQVALDSVLHGCELIVASPYTRALQTAAIISRVTGLKIAVEVDLYEWRPDKTYQYQTMEQSDELHRDFCSNRGVPPPGSEPRWESVAEMIARLRPVVDKYLAMGCKKIAIAAHGGVIRRFTGDAVVDYCKPYVIQYDHNYPFVEWVD